LQNADSKCQIWYWQVIPSGVKAWGDFDKAGLTEPQKFAPQVDAAMHLCRSCAQEASDNRLEFYIT
jgi:hypothetical protein